MSYVSFGSRIGLLCELLCCDDASRKLRDKNLPFRDDFVSCHETKCIGIVRIDNRVGDVNVLSLIPVASAMVMISEEELEVFLAARFRIAYLAGQFTVGTSFIVLVVRRRWGKRV